VTPYAGKTDEQVLAMAQAAYRRAGALPPRSGQRRAEWKEFDDAMCELMRRAMSHVLWKIHEMEAAGEDNVPDGSGAAVILELIERNGSDTGPAAFPGPGKS
jgi:hypothetical protein